MFNFQILLIVLNDGGSPLKLWKIGPFYLGKRLPIGGEWEEVKNV